MEGMSQHIPEQAGLGPETSSPLSLRAAGTQVVLGAEQALGAAVVEKLRGLQAEVRTVSMGPKAHSTNDDQDNFIRANPLVEAELAEACRGASTVYYCFEPKYLNRKRMLVEATSNALLASIETGCTFVYASHILSALDNASIEREVLQAHGSNLLQTVVARLPQLYGPGVLNPLWENIFESVLENEKAHWMGNPDVLRSLLFVEDAAVAMINLGNSVWAHGRSWDLPGPEPITGRRFIELAYLAVGKQPRVGRWGRGVMITGRYLASDARRFLEMPYDYYSQFVLDGREFIDGFPNLPFTPHDAAISKTIQWFGTKTA